ncbi:MAG: DUF4091 domain-containing protein [Verrucomicrobiae bacterium]|nr:DUF4091 domain-containing protein [Verrucomicrobiae bacterium]
MKKYCQFFVFCIGLFLSKASGADTPCVWVEDALVKVFPDAPPPGNPAAPVIRVQCAKNEYEPAQLLIRSKSLVENLSVIPGDLIHESGRQSISSKNITWNFVGFIPIEKNSVASAPERVVRVAPCEIPDVLLEEKNMALQADRTQPVWITFHVPKDAAAGKYTGKLELASGPVRIAVPVELEVWDFAVPDERHLFVSTWFNHGQMYRQVERENWGKSSGYWIWTPDFAVNSKGRVFFRRVFELAGEFKQARLRIKGDDSCVAHVNGKKIKSGSSWMSEDVCSIGEQLVQGKNVIAVEAKNSAGPGGVFAVLEIDMTNGKQIKLATDKTWRIWRADKNPPVSSDWKLAGADDGKWLAAGEVATASGGAWGGNIGALYEDEKFWEMLPVYLTNLAVHRNNISRAPSSLIKIHREEGGTLSFDYKHFDRFIEMLHDHGLADRIELQHVAFCDRATGKICLDGLYIVDRKTGRTDGLKDETILFAVLRDVEQHLASKGWIDKTVLHLADEPWPQNVAAYREFSRKVRQSAPRLKFIDAIETFGFGEDLDVWVPTINHLDNFYEQYQKARNEGRELWFYTCNNPWAGFYPNRGLDYPLPHARLMHWINYRYDLVGYLHWGYNQWYMPDPFGKPFRGEIAAPGDAFVVYPGKSGPLNSLRWEAQRDGIEDYEYLWVLGEKMKKLKQRLGKAAEEYDPTQRGKELCNLLITSLHQVNADPSQLRRARAAIAREIMEVDAEPAALVWTTPLAGAEMTWGPAKIQVNGAVEPGTKVKIDNTKGVYMGDDGRFASMTWISKKDEGADTVTVRVEVSGKGKQRTIKREFKIRK